jgi:hypothetical protein
MGHWIDLGHGRKRFVVEDHSVKTFEKFYGALDCAPVRGSALDGTPDFLMKSAPDKKRRALLKSHGRKALERSFKR